MSYLYPDQGRDLKFNIIKRHILIINSVFLIMLSACTPGIVKYYYNENIRCYDVKVKGMAWKGLRKNVARHPDGRKIQVIQEMVMFVWRYNRKPFYIPSSADWKLKEKDRFELMKLYYSGLRAYKDREFNQAVEYFSKAIKKDREIAKYSDIYFLLGKSYYFLNNNEKAKESFKNFLEYSESITHPNFQYFLPGKNDKKLDVLFDEAENHLKEEPEDGGHYLGWEYHEETHYARYRNRYYKAGFIKGPYKEKDAFGLGISYHGDSDYTWYLNIYSGITEYYDVTAVYVRLSNLNRLTVSLPVRIFADNHERFGIKFIPSFHYNRQMFPGILLQSRESWVNLEGDLSTGFYVNHYWFLYTGYEYFYFNENNPCSITHGRWKWHTWNYNNLYTGTTIYFYKDAGITLEYSCEKIMTYLDFMFFRFGYNITEDKYVISVFGHAVDEEFSGTRVVNR